MPHAGKKNNDVDYDDTVVMNFLTKSKTRYDRLGGGNNSKNTSKDRNKQ
jgi:hypothetical protein